MWMCLIIIETRFTIIIIIIIIIIITIIIITVIIMISTWWATARTDLPEQRRFCLVGANMSSDSPGLLSWSWSFCWCWLSWSWSFCWLLTEPMLCYGDQLVIIMIKIRIHLQNRGVFKDGPERRSSHLPYLESLLLLRYKATCPTSPSPSSPPLTPPLTPPPPPPLSPPLTPPPAELKSWRPCRGAAPNRCHRLASDPVLGLVYAVAREPRYLAIVIIMTMICKIHRKTNMKILI